MNDLVGTWEVPLYDKIHKIQFEHGTTTGRRVLWIDGEVNLNLFFFFLFRCLIIIDYGKFFFFEFIDRFT